MWARCPHESRARFTLVVVWLLMTCESAVHAQSPTLVAAFSFSEGSGTTFADSSGRNNNGTLAGPTWVAGRFDTALSFDGINDLATVLDAASLDLTNGMTLEAWVYPTQVNAWRTVLLKERPGHLVYALYGNTDTNQPSAEIATTSTGVDVRGPANLTVNVWTHVAGTYDGSALRLYINGVQAASRPVTGSLRTSSNPLRIGGNTVWGEYFAGRIDEVRIYSSALSAAQIQADMGTPIVPTDAVPPSVAITSPADGATLSDSVTVRASATDNVGVAGVQFLLDGSPLGAEDTTSPYELVWDTRTATNITHALSARARDGGGNVTTSTVLNVTVTNPDLGPPVRSGGSPSGTLASGTTSTLVSLRTNEPSTCRYAAVANTAYADMTSGFATSDGLFHSVQRTGLSDGGTYIYYVRCSDSSENVNPDDYLVLFSVATFTPVSLGTLNGHTVYGDSSQKIISWLTPQNAAYDRAVDIAWDFLLNRVPNDANGRKAYLTNSYLIKDTLAPSGWMHNPAHMNAAFIDSAILYYAYSGDGRVIDFARAAVNFHLANGMTSATWSWASVPYASGCGNCPYYDGSNTHDGVGVIEPDKVGELGYSLIRLFEVTGHAPYRDAAIRAADALASHVRTGTATRSPWPFRVNAQTNAVKEEYTANVIRPIMLFDELIRLDLGNVAAYQAARTTAWAWLMSYPMQNHVWSNYFEDVSVQSNLNNYNQYIAGETAYYILQHPELDPDWQNHAADIIAWIEGTFAGTQFGANTIKEQITYFHAMGSHTSRYGAVVANYHERTGDPLAKDKSYRALNWATYMISSSPTGQVIVGPTVDQVWFTDGYGDFIRHFHRAMGAVPEWAETNQSHLLRSSSVVRNIVYGSARIDYVTFDVDGIEVLKLNFAPTAVLANNVGLPQRTDLDAAGWVYDSAANVLKVRRQGAASIVVRGDPLAPGNIAPTVSLTSPAGGATFTAPATIQLAASAADSDGTIAKVDFYAGTTPLGTDTTAPYEFTWSNVQVGSYTLTAVATDDDGAAPSSAGVSITVAATTPSSTPFTGTEIALPGTIQAEDFDNGGEGIAYHDTTAGNSGGQYRATNVDLEATTDAGGGYNVGWMAAGEWLQYSVNVAAAGTYRLEARVAANGTGGTFHVEVGGVNTTGALTIPNTGGWQAWTTVSKSVTLAAGPQMLRLVVDAAGSTGVVGNVNSLLVTSTLGSGSTPFSGTAIGVPGTIQAENFDNGGEGIAYHDLTAGNAGGQYRATDVDLETTTDAGAGYDVGWMRAGEWLAYTVNVAAAGSYTLEARVASNGSGGTFHVEVNGVDKTGPLTVPNTGGWQIWQTLTKTVTLDAGVQVLRIVLDADGATGYVGNVNYLRFSAP